jgi:hypothetical protein
MYVSSLNEDTVFRPKATVIKFKQFSTCTI